jgi:hypothetical protein
VSDWDFKAASFSGVLNGTASDITVDNAGKTDTDNAESITTTTVTLETDVSNFLIGTLYNTENSGSSITNNDYSVSVGTDGVVSMVTSRGTVEFGALPEPGVQATSTLCGPLEIIMIYTLVMTSTMYYSVALDTAQFLDMELRLAHKIQMVAAVVSKCGVLAQMVQQHSQHCQYSVVTTLMEQLPGKHNCLVTTAKKQLFQHQMAQLIIIAVNAW